MMAKMEGSINVNVVDGARLIASALDRARRNAVQRRNSARSAEGEAYYEGMRTGLAEMQALAEKVIAA